MNNQEYEQKKRECWEEFRREYPEISCKSLLRNFVDFIFDRAYALGKQETKQEKDADTVIQGWVCRNKEGDIFLYKQEPNRIYDGEYSRWEEDVVCTQPLPRELFPDLTWDDDPIEVELIIKRKNNG